MLRKKNGVFVNIASVAGILGNGGGVAYTSSKHGVIGLTKHIATFYKGQGIRCNAICPGLIETPMVTEQLKDPDYVAGVNAQCGRIGQPEDIADAVIFLASNKSSYINGVALPVDGGLVVC